MEFDPQRVIVNVRNAPTDDLLDRITVYRAGMEAEAIEIIEGELQDRGVYRDQIRDYAAKRQQDVIVLEDGTAATCSFCRRPAVARGWGWHWLRVMAWGKRRPIVPLFPRYFNFCDVHRPLQPSRSSRPSAASEKPTS